MTDRRCSYLLRPRLMALDIACAPLQKAFGCVYIVGSCLERSDYRDVDVRCMLTLEQWRGLFGELDPVKPFLDPRWELLCMTMSLHLATQSGLPVEFQYQEIETTRTEHPGRRSLAIGCRGLA